MEPITIEISLYVFVAVLLFAIRTVLSGMKNGCFYFKNTPEKTPMLKKYIANLHFIETPAWYVQTGGVFLFVLSIARLLNPVYNWTILISLLASALITTGSFTLPSYWYQRGITGGTKSDDELDEADGNKSEVAISILGIKIQFWKRQLFYNKGRKLAIYVGILEIIIGILLLNYRK